MRGSWEVMEAAMGGWWTMLVLLVLADVILRGMGMWRAAKKGQQGWFVAMLVINSVGILPVVYMLFFEKKGKK